MTDKPQATPRPMATGEVAHMFGVDPKTVTRWAVDGRLRSFRTPGGHRRFRPEEVEALRGLYRKDQETPVKTYDADDPRADKPLTKAEREAEEEADRKRDEKKSGH